MNLPGLVEAAARRLLPAPEIPEEISGRFKVGGPRGSLLRKLFLGGCPGLLQNETPAAFDLLQ